MDNVKGQTSFALANSRLMYAISSSFVVGGLSFADVNSFAEAKVGLRLGEPKASTLQSSTSQWQSSLFALENCFADVKVLLRLSETVPLISGSAFLSFSPYFA